MKKSPHGIYLVVALSLTLAAIVALYLISQTERIQVIDRANSPVVSADTLAAGPSAYLLTELQQYRSFIEVERREYQQFLTRMYATIGVLIAALGGILTFLGIKTLEDLKRKSEEKIEQARKEIQEQTEQKMQAKLSELVDERLGEKEHLVAALQQLASQRTLWDKAKIRIFADGADEKAINGFEKRYFENGGAETVKVGPFSEKEPLDEFQALIYCYRPKIKGEPDKRLVEDLLPKLEEKRLPLIVYDYHYKEEEWIHREDKKALSEYPYGALANVPFSLIANTYDAVTLNMSKS